MTTREKQYRYTPIRGHSCTKPLITRIIRRIGCTVSALLMLMSMRVDCFADVISTEDHTGPADYIYVAGNPDLYPVEYYDPEDKCFKGIVPELLSQISESTGLSFAYIDADGVDHQSELARNYQVEMVTSFLSGKFNNRVVPVQTPIFKVEINGGNSTICIGFTQIASDELRETIINAFESIPDSDKLSIAISRAIEVKPEKKEIPIWIMIGIPVGVLLIAIVVAVLIHRRKKKNTIASMTDELGIGNAVYYTYSFERLIPEQVKELYYVAYISCGNLKENGIFTSEEIGDIQKYAAQQLNTLAGSTEYVSKIDECVFTFVYQSSNRNDAQKRIEEILDSLNNYLCGFSPDYAELFKTGICSIADNPDCNAEYAFGVAKQGYLYAVRNQLRYAFSTNEVIKKTAADEKMRRSISKAIDNKEFQIYLQFITDSKSEKICGAEVLSRWDNPEMGIISPDKYIGIMKSSGTIARHDYYIFESICALLDGWKGTEHENLFLSCNFTRLSASSKDFSGKIREISDKYDFCHGNLVIELTEDTLIENADMVRFNIEECRNMGFKIAIDDMGSGFSAISDLYRNEIDIVKIEREFVIGGVNEKGHKLLESMVSLAHNMNAKALCEGIETEAQHEMIMGIDCDYIQGFYYSRVLPYEEAMRFLNSSNG